MRSRQGATLVELLIGLALLALGAVGTMHALGQQRSVLSERIASAIASLSGGSAESPPGAPALSSDPPLQPTAAPEPARDDSPSVVSWLWGHAQEGFDRGKAELDVALTPARVEADAIAKGAGWLEQKIDEGEANSARASQERAQLFDDVPVLGPLAHAASWAQTQQSQFEGGVEKGAIDFVSGLPKMAADPIGTAKGLEALGEHVSVVPGAPNALKVGHGLLNAATGQASLDDELHRTLDPLASSQEDGQFLTNMITAPYKESWKQGKYSEVAGHVTFDLAALIASDGLGEGAAGGELAADAERTSDLASQAGAAERAAALEDETAAASAHAPANEPAPGPTQSARPAGEPECHDGICTLGCFAAGTLVLTEHGDRPIESIVQGDRVWSRDPETGVLALRPVLQTFVHDAQVVDLTVRSDTQTEHLTVTPNHPFWVQDIGWVEAGKLAEAALLSTPQGALTGHAGLSWGELTKVYNLEVAESHTYFVGALHAWVHNQGAQPCPTPVSSGSSRASQQNTPNSIYEQIGPDGKVRSRTFYDDNGNSFARQDFDHTHAGLQPHEHQRDFDANGRPITGKSFGPVPPGYDETPTRP